MSSSGSRSQPWPPVWKPIEECPQYKMLSTYINLRSRLRQAFGDSECKPPYYHRFMELLNQVMESRGYDFDYYKPPELFNLHLPFTKSSTAIYASGHLKIYLESMVNFVVAKINEEAEKHGEYYEYHGVVQIVEALRNDLLTITVRNIIIGQIKTVQAMVYNYGNDNFELEEWRFKPDITLSPFRL